MKKLDIKSLGTLQDYGDTTVELLVDNNENTLYIAIPVSDDYQYAIVKVSPVEVLQYMKGEVSLINIFSNKEIRLWSWLHRTSLGKTIPFGIIKDELDDIRCYQREYGSSYNLINSFLKSGYGTLLNQNLRTVKA